MLGGYRPGSGRKPAKPKVRPGPLQVARQLAEALEAEAAGQTRQAPSVTVEPLVGPDGKPLKHRKFKDSMSYAMAVINDPTVNGERKDRLAIAMMPFQHAKIAEKPLGKKEQQALDAKRAGNGSDWDDLMTKPVTPNFKIAA